MNQESQNQKNSETEAMSNNNAKHIGDHLKKLFPFLLCCVVGVIAALLILKKGRNENKAVSAPYYNYERYFQNTVSLGDAEYESDKTNLPVYAGAYAAVDYRDGHLLCGKNYEERLPMASTTKILTAIVVLENSSLNDIVTVSAKAAGSPKVHLGVKKGEQYYVQDLLYSMLLESHNDSAVALAEHVGGSTEEFAKLMNSKAKEIGALNSSFVTPNGLDDDNHFSTAYDMALIGSYAIRNEKFVDIVNTKSYSFSEINGKAYHSVSNINTYLTMDSTAIGIKTGFTGKAGYCFVGANKYKDTVVVSCVLASGWYPNRTFKWHDMREIMKYVREKTESVKYNTGGKNITVCLDKSEKADITLKETELTLLSDKKENIYRIIKVEPDPKTAYEDAEGGSSPLKEEKATEDCGKRSKLNANISSKDMSDSGYCFKGYRIEDYIFYGNVELQISDGLSVK